MGLLLLLPVFLILSIWIFAYDRGPVLYKQARIGRGGKPFGVYKFRTMVVNADQIGPLSTGEHDPRITAPGRFLRKTSLDELPQLLNVLLGDMSLVGYRPNVSDLIDWSDEAYLRLLVHASRDHRLRAGVRAQQ